MADYYLWIKAAHIIFVIFWCAGLLMMPRFFVYHSQSEVNSAEDKAWRDRELRLQRIITNPAMVLSWLFGVLLMFLTGALFEPWFWVKVVGIITLTTLQMMTMGWRRRFAAGHRERPESFYRKVNEIPSLVIIVIVIMVIVRPF